MDASSTTVPSAADAAAPTSLGADLVALTKARLSFLVVVTTFVGFWIGSGGDIDGWLLLHTIVGTSMAALGSSVFNQLMEIEADSRMNRTRTRPLPGRRLPPAAAFGIGWVLSAFALIHLGTRVNFEAAVLTALTLGIYIFIYTPLKQRSSWNTIVGAVAGAIPPVIGWVAAAGPDPSDAVFRWRLLLEPGAIFLFALLFLWQLPHFLAINWIYRDEYIRGGFRMWSNDDSAGRKTGALATIFSSLLIPLMLLPPAAGNTGVIFPAIAIGLSLVMTALAACLLKDPSRKSARRLFFFTLLYLPLLLLTLAFTWKTPTQSA